MIDAYGDVAHAGQLGDLRRGGHAFLLLTNRIEARASTRRVQRLEVLSLSVEPLGEAVVLPRFAEEGVKKGSPGRGVPSLDPPPANLLSGGTAPAKDPGSEPATTTLAQGN